MKRVVLVYNPRSSHFWQVEQEVIAKARKLRGVALLKYEVADTDVDENALRLARIIADGDIVIAAGGDGTANIALNGVMLSEKQVARFGVLGFGNFNDAARMCGRLNFEEIFTGATQEVWPLGCLMNGRHWRYAMCYFSMGMFAEACAVFDEPKVRKKLQKKHHRRGLLGSLWTLFWWWLTERKREFLPEFEMFGSDGEKTEYFEYSDLMAVNSPKVARVMRGGDFYRDKQYFLSFTGRMNRFWGLLLMMLRSVFGRIPGVESERDLVKFEEPIEVMMQAEGEYKKFKGVSTVEIRKAGRAVKVVMK